MRILITGICGHVGSRLALRFAESLSGVEIVGIDNLSRHGTETNLDQLRRIGARLVRADLRNSSDLQALPDADWVVDCAANPAVTAGVGAATGTGGCTPAQLVEHNLGGTLNLLEYCRERSAGLVLLSSSRVYSVAALSDLPLQETDTRLTLRQPSAGELPGLSEHGIAEGFPATSPVSLYGASKLASEVMALEYGDAFAFPVWINRCGVIGGPHRQRGRWQQRVDVPVRAHRPLRRFLWPWYRGAGQQRDPPLRHSLLCYRYAAGSPAVGMATSGNRRGDRRHPVPVD